MPREYFSLQLKCNILKRYPKVRMKVKYKAFKTATVLHFHYTHSFGSNSLWNMLKDCAIFLPQSVIYQLEVQHMGWRKNSRTHQFGSQALHDPQCNHRRYTRLERRSWNYLRLIVLGPMYQHYWAAYWATKRSSIRAHSIDRQTTATLSNTVNNSQNSTTFSSFVYVFSHSCLFVRKEECFVDYLSSLSRQHKFTRTNTQMHFTRFQLISVAISVRSMRFQSADWEHSPSRFFPLAFVATMPCNNSEMKWNENDWNKIHSQTKK